MRAINLTIEPVSSTTTDDPYTAYSIYVATRGQPSYLLVHPTDGLPRLFVLDAAGELHRLVLSQTELIDMCESILNEYCDLTGYHIVRE